MEGEEQSNSASAAEALGVPDIPLPPSGHAEEMTTEEHAADKLNDISPSHDAQDGYGGDDEVVAGAEKGDKEEDLLDIALPPMGDSNAELQSDAAHPPVSSGPDDAALEEESGHSAGTPLLDDVDLETAGLDARREEDDRTPLEDEEDMVALHSPQQEGFQIDSEERPGKSKEALETLSPVSNSSLPLNSPPMSAGSKRGRRLRVRGRNVSPPKLLDDDEDGFSSFSEESVLVVPQSPDVLLLGGKDDLEDGEIGSKREKSKNKVERTDKKKGKNTKKSDSRKNSDRKRRRSRDRSRSLDSDRNRSKKRTNLKDLPRYDVRNIINRKRGLKGGGRSRSRSRSWSRSRSRSRHRRTRSRSRSRSFSISPSRSRSRSYSPVSKKKGSKGTKKKGGKVRKSSVSPARKKSAKSQKKKDKKVKKVGAKQSKRKSSSSDTPATTSKKKKDKTVGSKASKKKKSTASALTPTSSAKKTPSLPTTDKEVFASGDNILVSINFGQKDASKKKKRSDKNDASDPSALASPITAASASSNKASVVIDIMQSPYQVFEPSPQETIDLHESDEESIAKKAKRAAAEDEVSPENVVGSGDLSAQSAATVKDSSSEKGGGGGGGCAANAPPVLTAASVIESLTSSVTTGTFANSGTAVNSISVTRGPCTPPLDEAIDFAKGPQTPPQSDIEDSYDPCNPTESPEYAHSPNDDDEEDHDGVNGSELLIAAHDILNGNGNPNSVTGANPGKALFMSEASGSSNKAKDSADVSLDYPIDMDMDSPSSPQGSDLSDLFEPPSLNGGSASAPSSAKKKGLRQSNKANGFSRLAKGPSKAKKKSNKATVQMKLVDDKLRIIDDVPTSAVEMAVKEKFLKKVQRQERIVDEIKMVLKPFYNKKKISKSSYKEIMRKCVPKVCHSKNGAINTIKIQRLVQGYVKKYHHFEKKQKLPK